MCGLELDEILRDKYGRYVHWPETFREHIWEAVRGRCAPFFTRNPRLISLEVVNMLRYLPRKASPMIHLSRLRTCQNSRLDRDLEKTDGKLKAKSSLWIWCSTFSQGILWLYWLFWLYPTIQPKYIGSRKHYAIRREGHSLWCADITWKAKYRSTIQTFGLAQG